MTATCEEKTLPALACEDMGAGKMGTWFFILQTASVRPVFGPAIACFAEWLLPAGLGEERDKPPPPAAR